MNREKGPLGEAALQVDRNLEMLLLMRTWKDGPVVVQCRVINVAVVATEARVGGAGVATMAGPGSARLRELFLYLSRMRRTTEGSVMPMARIAVVGFNSGLFLINSDSRAIRSLSSIPEPFGRPRRRFVCNITLAFKNLGDSIFESLEEFAP